MVEHDAGVGRGHAVHFGARNPDAVDDVEPRSEQARALEVADQRAAVLREQLARDQRLAPGLVDVGVDGEIVLVRRARRSLPASSGVQRCGANGATAQCTVPTGRMALELVLEVVELLAHGQRLGAEHLLHVGRQAVLVADHGDRRNVPDHGREHDAQPDVAVGVDSTTSVYSSFERREAEHVLHGGDAAAQRFECADQRARAHLLLAAVLPHRQRVEQPEFERQLLEQTAAQGVVGVIVRIDEPGHDQLARRVDDLMRPVGSQVRADRDDIAAVDQDVGDRRPVDVAVVVVDLSASHQQLLRVRHRVISFLVSSAGSGRTSSIAGARALHQPSTCCWYFSRWRSSSS